MGKIGKKINLWGEQPAPDDFNSVNGMPCPKNRDWMDAMLKMPGAMRAEHEAAMAVSDVSRRLLPEALGINPSLLHRGWPDPVESMPPLQVNQMIQIGGRKGLPDWFFTVPRGGYVGLCIEQKLPGGVLSPEQIKVKACLQQEKWAYTTSRSPKGFFDVMVRYLEGEYSPSKTPIPDDPEEVLPRRPYDHV